MSDYARFKNIEPMYKKRIHDQEMLIKALREKIRILEQGGTSIVLDSVIENNTRIYEAEIVEDDK